ncbi:uncharacterized protein LOC143460531 isoform X1 [Clavelina lepadiformis]|uniref:uncharacterized protein LOC143460531 isoform X1 n=1 Tax=Clavelina lepadiformis TaxID=159417 RepID=UPI004042D1E1
MDDNQENWEITSIPSEKEQTEQASAEKRTHKVRQEIIPTPDSESFPPKAEFPSRPITAFSVDSQRNLTSNKANSSPRGQNGVFATFGRLLRDMFHRGRGGLDTTRVSPETGSKFFNPATSSKTPVALKPSQPGRTDEIIMQNLGGDSESSSHKQCINQQETDIYKVEHSNVSDYSLSDELGCKRNVYEAGIYSVNSAGDPVPITIEESRNDIDLISVSGEESDDDIADSKVQLQPKFIFSKFACNLKQTAAAIWRKTYQPDSDFIYYWLFLVTLAVLYNLWVIPLRAGFIADIQIPWQGVWFTFDALCDLIYIIDIVIKFRTRYMQGGIYVKQIRMLNQQHRRHWTVVLDFLSIFPTDLFFIQSINPYYRLNRVLRLYRAYAFYRMAELKTRWQNCLRIGNLFHFVVVVIHYNSCIYYAASVANGYGDLLTSWAYPNPSLFPEYQSLTRRYTFSFYWSIRELTFIGGRPLPETDWQFAYSIYLNLVGISLSAFIIGYVTTLLMGKNTEKFDFEHAMATTMRFLRRKQLPKDLRNRVEQFYTHVWNRSEFGHLDETALLRHLPISVKEEIAYHCNYVALKQLPAFSSCESNVVRDLVMRMQRRTYLPGQFVYRSGDAGSEMYIVGEGTLQIVRERDGEVTTAKKGDVFGEMNIFNLRKCHRRSCDVVSCGYSELYMLTSKNVDETLLKYPRVMNMVFQQAKRHDRGMSRNSSTTYFSRQQNTSSFYTKLSSTDGVQSASNVHLMMKGGTASKQFRKDSEVPNQGGSRWTGFNQRDDSPDSGMPPSPARRQASEHGARAFSCAPPNDIGMIIRPDLAEKLNTVYQRNLVSLQNSIHTLWQHEISILQQQIAAAESERDNRAREVIQMRHQARKTKDKETVGGARYTSVAEVQMSAPGNNSESSNQQKEVTKEAKDISLKNTSTTKRDSIKSDQEISTAGVKQGAKKSNAKILPGNKGQRRRTVLPSNAESTVSLNSNTSDATTSSAVTEQARKVTQATPLDVYGSLTSVK